MNLHEWVAERVAVVERLAQEAEGGVWAAAEGDGGTAATVLRRCEADRRVLARHCQDMQASAWYHSAACSGCGVGGDCDDPVIDNINECPELLDLAHAHGITAGELAALDPPQTTPRPPETPGQARARKELADLLFPGEGAES